MKTLCPLDPDKVGKKSSEQEGEGEDSSKEENNERRRRRNHFGGARLRAEQGGLLAPSVAHAVNINGRRVLLCSFNGITFQVSQSLSLSLSLSHTHTHTHTHTLLLLLSHSIYMRTTQIPTLTP